ncbi:unnamed protein product [Rhizophagus irregularis]|nr:unnamed protein product [Rhizophagus irregularis]
MGSVKCLVMVTPTSDEWNQDSFGWVSKEPKEGTKIRKYIRILTDWLYFLDTKIDRWRYLFFLLRTFTHLPVDFKTFCLLILFFGKR